MNGKKNLISVCFCEQQFWNDASAQGGIRGWPRRDEPQESSLNVPRNFEIVDVPNAVPKKNCTGSGGNCIPKCFAEKGNQGPPGSPGLPGPKGSLRQTIRRMKLFHSSESVSA